VAAGRRLCACQAHCWTMKVPCMDFDEVRYAGGAAQKHKNGGCSSLGWQAGGRAAGRA